MKHEKRVSLSTTWVTQMWIFDWVGVFDLDPATFDGHPWPCARENRSTGGLDAPWYGRVFLNPPYESRQIEPFMQRMAEHSNGVAVIAARIETKWFQDYVFGAAKAVWFPRGRIKFCRPDGTEAKSVAFPSCVAFYEEPPAESPPRDGTWWTKSVEDCPKCDGAGSIYYPGPGGRSLGSYTDECADCHGTGTRVAT